jgi:hypothetical protein
LSRYLVPLAQHIWRARDRDDFVRMLAHDPSLPGRSDRGL